jgi:IrrE N-terminal-like domain
MLTASALLPPTRKGRRYERKALKIRDFAGVKLDQRLDPFALAGYANLHVISLDQIQGLSPEARTQLIEVDPRSWSGGASRILPDGSRLIILNPTHGRERQAATLMEEVCHVFLGHQPNRLGVPIAKEVEGSRQVRHRDYNEVDEEEAYAVGAAALLPYFALRKALEESASIQEVARRYGVSRQLVEYRLKVSHLWSAYKMLAGEERADL